MPRPETLLEMRSVRSPPDWKSRRPLPLTHSKLPAITSFQGLMARIDAPLFHDVTIRCFHPFIFSISPPASLFSRTTKFKASPCGPLQSPRHGHAFLHQHRHCPVEHSHRKNLTRRVRTAGCKPAPETKVSHSSPVQVCASSSLPFPLDASFTFARVNIRDYIGNAAKLVL
jgi:hypothetical protein